MDKVLMVAATPFFSDRGCHIRIYNEIKYLKKNGYETILCTYHNGNEVDGINTRRSLNIPWYKKTTPGASWHKLYIDIFLFFTTLKTFIKEKPKVIHVHLYEGLVIGWLVKALTFSRVKLVFDCQGSLAEEMYAYTLHKNKFYKKFYNFFKFIEKILLKIPDDIVCSSSNSYDFLHDNYIIDKGRIHLLEDGIDLELFENSKNIISRADLGFSSEDLVFVYAGSLSAAKGVNYIIDALPQIFEVRPDIKFLLVGYGDLEDDINSNLKKYISSGQLVITGRVNYFELPQYLMLADYAVEPKKGSSESSGKLYNYLAAKLPVVCFEGAFNLKVIGSSGIFVNNLNSISSLEKDNTKIKLLLNHQLSLSFSILKLISIYEQ